MGISGFEEMTRLAKVARPDICVLTNIGVAHMENLGSRDGILKAKTEMFAYMNENGTIILNGDDDKLRGYSPENGITPVYFGLDESCGFHAENISGKGLNGTDAQFSHQILLLRHISTSRALTWCTTRLRLPQSDTLLV